MTTLASDRFYKCDGISRLPDGMLFSTVTYTYESAARLYDVRAAQDGRLYYRVNMGEWSTTPTREHQAIVKHFGLR